MAQFDVYRNPNTASRTRILYLLDVQSDLLDLIATRVVVPLARPDVIGNKAAERLNPVFMVEARRVVMLTPELASVPRTAIGVRVANLSAHRNEVIAALDLVFTGI